MDELEREGIALAKGAAHVRVDIIESGIRKEKELLLTELIVMDRVSGEEAWYIDNDELCYYIRTQKEEPTSGVVLYSGIPKSQWEELVMRVWTEREYQLQGRDSNVMIALPGTEAGQSGLYVDKRHAIVKWIRDDDQWKRILY